MPYAARRMPCANSDDGAPTVPRREVRGPADRKRQPYAVCREPYAGRK
ncbi:MAG: hypothetical protein ACR2L2_09025 [Acidobacteriota bacterium]